MAASPDRRRPGRPRSGALAADAAVAIAAAGAVAAAVAWPATASAAPSARDAGARPRSVIGAAPARNAVAAPTPRLAWSAQIVHPAIVRAAPGPRSRRIGRIGTTAAWTGGRVRLLVLGVRSGPSGPAWLRVLLPDRPNGRSGWIDADLARLAPLRWRVEIDVRARRLTAIRDGRRVRSWRVVVGTRSTPTPRGTFAVYERVRQPLGSMLGPWALHLTAHSNVLFDYGGGPGRVAMHGRSGPLLADPLGSASSHGCIRMANANVRWLAARTPPGTPVAAR